MYWGKPRLLRYMPFAWHFNALFDCNIFGTLGLYMFFQILNSHVCLDYRNTLWFCLDYGYNSTKEGRPTTH